MAKFKGLDKQSQKSKDDFNKEWIEAITRFKVMVGFKSFNLNLKHPKTKNPAKPHEAIPEIFHQWQEIQSIWDRRSLIFEAIYQFSGQFMKPWQVANYLVAIREPLEAFDILLEASKNQISQEDYGLHCAALANTLNVLSYYEDALQWAQKANQAVSNDRYFQVLLADSYWLCRHCDEANTIYQNLIAQIPQSEDDSISQMFSDFFALETGAIPSPIFAIQIGKKLSDPSQAEEFWQLAEAEFYHNPYFRMNHAYYLTDRGETERGFAKLATLVKEMPWLREANLNLVEYFNSFNAALGKQIMPELEAEVRQRIQENAWTI